MKKFISLTLILLFFSGCSINMVHDESFDSIINTVLYKDNNLFNSSFDGFKFYLPRGLTVKEKKKNNLEIKDQKNTYYLYVDTVAYYYKNSMEFKEDENIFYSKYLKNNNNFGFVNISLVNSKYFIEIVYNYAKIETYIGKNDINDSLQKICELLSSIKYNDSAIKYKLSTHEFDMTTEEFSIFKSKKDDDNFLKYVEEFDKYDKKKNKDNDIIETNEGE